MASRLAHKNHELVGSKVLILGCELSWSFPLRRSVIRSGPEPPYRPRHASGHTTAPDAAIFECAGMARGVFGWRYELLSREGITPDHHDTNPYGLFVFGGAVRRHISPPEVQKGLNLLTPGPDYTLCDPEQQTRAHCQKWERIVPTPPCEFSPSGK